jgi:hypothetical protein
MVVYLRPGFGGSDEGLKPYVEDRLLSAKAIMNTERENTYLIEPLTKM